MSSIKCLFYSKYFLAFKYLIPILLSIWTYSVTGNAISVIVCLLELMIIFIISNVMLIYNSRLAYLFNTLCLLLFNIDQLILIFGGTYLSLIMISNLDSFSALSGKFPLFFIGFTPVIFLSFLPIKRLDCYIEIEFVLFFLSSILNLSFVSSGLVHTTPLYNYYQLSSDKIQQVRIQEEINNSDDLSFKFYRETIADGIDKPNQLIGVNPNIILIFTEGLSHHIINDERQFMPNLFEFQKNSISFKNYYNHTFATYRGLVGQLYSGYQFDNYDSNSLISIQEILRERNYETMFINSEPENKTFTDYLKNFNFEKIITKKNKLKGVDNTLSDKEAYSLLLKEINKRSQKNMPFFISLYTFGTHVSLDSVDRKFGSGENPLFNKFYDLDYQFGQFLKEFRNSPAYDNTIIVFTTDHATYVDDDYRKSFTDHNRSFGSLDSVPFFIYHKGISSSELDVNGRNSLDLAPTILDYIDISAPNYFLGTSLFDKTPTSKMSYIFNSELNVLSSENSQITNVDDNSILDILSDYFKAAQK